MAAATKRRVTKTELLNRVLDLVTNGRFDSQLELIATVVRQRQVAMRDQRAMKNLAELSMPGTRVRIVHNVKPRYLLGLEGTVVEKPEAFFSSTPSPSTIYVDLGRRVRRYGPVVGCPASTLEAA